MPRSGNNYRYPEKALIILNQYGMHTECAASAFFKIKSDIRETN